MKIRSFHFASTLILIFISTSSLASHASSAMQTKKDCRPYYSFRAQKIYDPNSEVHFSLNFKFNQNLARVDYASKFSEGLEMGEQIIVALDEVKLMTGATVQQSAPSFYTPVMNSIRNPRIDQHLKFPNSNRMYFHVLNPIRRISDKSSAPMNQMNRFKWQVMSRKPLWINVNGDVTYKCQ